MLATKWLFCSGGIIQPTTFSTVSNSFFLELALSSRVKYFLNTPFQPTCQPTYATTTLKNHRELYCNLKLPDVPPNHHLLSWALICSLAFGLNMLQSHL